MEPLRISVIGSYRSGKTSLIRKTFDVPMNKEGFYNVKIEGFPLRIKESVDFTDLPDGIIQVVSCRSPEWSIETTRLERARKRGIYTLIVVTKSDVDIGLSNLFTLWAEACEIDLLFTSARRYEGITEAFQRCAEVAYRIRESKRRSKCALL